ncbi:MAG: patatin-like phospholipase family protein [Pseudomonadota bacterium]
MEKYTKNSSDVIEAESDYLDKKDTEGFVSLAFSGGGIRSASFGMGVLQALVAHDRLKSFDFMSTVSGGGYLGSSLTWFLSQRKRDGEPSYGTSAENFPFGTRPHGEKNNSSTSILGFIRQHGNYLIPGGGLNASALIATLLRAMLVTFTVYFFLIASLFCIIFPILNRTFPEASTLDSWIEGTTTLALIVAGGWLFLVFFYSIVSFFKGKKYELAVWVQRASGKFFIASLVFMGLSLLAVLHENLPQLLEKLFAETDQEHLAKQVANGSISFTSALLGALFAIYSHVKKTRDPSAEISNWKIVLGALALIFGLTFGAFSVALYIDKTENELYFWVVLCSSLVVGLVCNINYFGLNRMYRDRLMETFMPDSVSIESGRWAPASDANEAKVENMCAAPNQRPYHLVNCNVVLVDSDNAKYRGRNGDNFVVSPLYCGSDATGWRKTKEYMHSTFRNGLTLPTAMATSGAAANPNAGVGGKGISTNPIVSTLMSLLGLRLGFWASNPKSEKSWLPPNYFYPGLKGGVPFGSGLSENNRAIELTDGGHFENLGIYELLRRRSKLIVVSDAGADSEYVLSDLANAVERARVDFGATISFGEKFPLEEVMPDSDEAQSDVEKSNYQFAKRGFAIAKIHYPSSGSTIDSVTKGYLIYIKPTMIKGLNADILSYKNTNNTFPHESTADQFFNEVQFEAYRELGFQIGNQVLGEATVVDIFDSKIKG